MDITARQDVSHAGCIVSWSLLREHCFKQQNNLLHMHANLKTHMMQAQVSNLPFQWQVTDENLASGLCYTSGTTGNPKVSCMSDCAPISCEKFAFIAICDCKS